MNTTPRIRQWQSALAALFASRMNAPFAWGRNDCCLFAADAILAMTGVDPAQRHRHYATEGGAFRALARLGGLAAVAAQHCGAEIEPARARIGDVVLGVAGSRECLGICTGELWHAPGADGLVAMPLGNVLRAWRVG